MIKSSTVQFSPLGGDVAEDGLFHILLVDETLNSETGTDLPQNESVWVLIQIDPKLKIVKVEPSCGTQREGGTVTYDFDSIGVFFNEDSKTHTLPYMPDSGSLTGIWFLDTVVDLYSDSGPDWDVLKNVITVDVDTHGRSAVASFDYTATFKSWEIIPPLTNLDTQDDKHYIGLTVFYEDNS